MHGPGKSKPNVLVVSGGTSSEHDVSLASGRQVVEHLDPRRFQSTSVVIDRTGRWRWHGQRGLPLARSLEKITRSGYAIVFIALHGRFGEDGAIQTMMESIGIPYTGSGPAASAVAMDKNLSNQIYQATGFDVPKWNVIDTTHPAPPFRRPCVVKPIDAGSSVDTYCISRRSEYLRACRSVVKKYRRAMIQDLVRGRELTCGVLDDVHGRSISLMPTEIIPRLSGWFDYRAKYTPNGSQELTPAPIGVLHTKEIQKLALKAHTNLGCRGMSRSDFIFDGNTFWILETNTIPGMTETSLLPQGAAATGIPFSTMLEMMIRSGMQRT